MLYIDNTTLSDVKRCLRYAYYRHQRHWVPEGAKSPALVFGAAWHKAMDAVWPAIATHHESPAVAAELGFDAFMDEWNAEPRDPFAPEDLGARTPETARATLLAYCEARHSLISQAELLAVEQPFGYALDPSITYIGRIDKIARIDGKVTAIEHKTTASYAGRGGDIHPRSAYLDSFSPNAQVDGYLSYLERRYGSTRLWVDITLVHRTVHDRFTLLPVQRTAGQLEHSRETARWWADLYLAQGRDGGPWPRNTNSCFEYNRACPYLSLCKAFDDPWNRELPVGFREEPWEPIGRIEDLTASAKATWLTEEPTA